MKNRILGTTAFAVVAATPFVALAQTAEPAAVASQATATLDEIVVTAGAQESIFVAMLAFLNPGDEVIIASPGYTTYHQAVELADGGEDGAAELLEVVETRKPREIEKTAQAML
jgi:Cys-tRNA synthase (O-phospho-L-seryl-tRNA:Cys-tRNA synthase)